jgi:hypothetical protein
MDVVMLAISVAFFALTWRLVRFADREIAGKGGQ